MSDCAPRTNVQTCLAELHKELAKLGVTVIALRDQSNRACLEVYDRHHRSRRVYVLAQLFWFCWGAEPAERHSIFHPHEAATHLAHVALGDGWPPDQSPGDLNKILARFLPDP